MPYPPRLFEEPRARAMAPESPTYRVRNRSPSPVSTSVFQHSRRSIHRSPSAVPETPSEDALFLARLLTRVSDQREERFRTSMRGEIEELIHRAHLEDLLARYRR